MNIVFTGPMGAGKTTIGTEVARVLNMNFIDTDRMIEKISGCSINELFAREGQEHFRKIEKQAIKDVSRLENTIIATGGGAVLLPENMRALRSNGIIINLHASAEILSERLKNASRPLLDLEDGLKKYLDEREIFYSNADFKIDTGIMNIQESVNRVCAIAKMPFIRICGCISGNNAKTDIQTAVKNGVSMIELRLDLIPDSDIKSLIQTCGVPVIATDRENKGRLKEAILAGCDFVDIEFDSPEKDEIIQLARQNNCKVICSMHTDSVPDNFPPKGDADILKLAVKIDSEEDLDKLLKLHGHHENIIIIGMGEIGIPLRVMGPLLGSYLTYSYIGKPVANGQLDLETMIAHYREMGLK